MMKRTLLASLCALAAACGGSEKLDPTTVTFGYPAATPVVAGSPESTAASLGEVGAQDAQTLPTEQDKTLATAQADSIVGMPEGVAEACMGSPTATAAALAAPAQARMEKRAAGFARGVDAAAFEGFDDPSCVTLLPGGITFANCRETQTDPYGGTSTVTVNGQLTRTIVVGVSATASWDVRVGISSTDGTFTMNVSSHLYGTFTVVPGNLSGHSQNDTSVSVSVPGTSVRGAVTHLGEYDLDFTTDPAICPTGVTGGTLEVRRVWTARPAGADPAETRDMGVRFTWAGCGNVNVAWGTRN